MAEQIKTWFLYELINHYGTIEWVGVTYRPDYRWRQHTQVRPNPTKKAGYGTFYGRLDLTLHIVHEYENRKEALREETRLKREYGLEVGELAGLKAVDKQKAGKAGAAAQLKTGRIQSMGRASMAKIHQCPHCLKEIKGAVYGVWHGDNCKQNPNKHG
jgi:predicted GIY-YIG superfamily endonuclease/ribosomal protein L37AE/L43A